MTIQEKAIEQLERISHNLGSIGETVDYTDIAIEALEQTEWIPVTERLPEPQTTVLITKKRWGGRDNDLFQDLSEYTYATYFAFYNPHFGFSDEVIAWMPLPEPYKEDAE